MPVEISVIDTSQRASLRSSEAARLTADTPAESLRALEATESGEKDLEQRALVVPVNLEELERRELLERFEYEGERLEAETRLALTVERVEIDRSADAVKVFGRSAKVVLFGSLELDVTV